MSNKPIPVSLQLNSVDVHNLLKLLQRAGYENMDEAEVGVVLKQMITRQYQAAVSADEEAKAVAAAKDTKAETKPARKKRKKVQKRS